MNADLLKRLFRAISNATEPSLVRLAEAIVDDERQKGHGALAQQLEGILQQSSNGPKRAVCSGVDHFPALGTLPVSKRGNEPLASLIPAECLRHHMVLPAPIEGRFRRIESEYAARERLARYGFRPRRKVLLYGPPGCGKSLGAERLGWTTGLPLLKVRFDSMMSSFFGESATNLRSVFETSRTTSCLLFLDECDFVARSRTSTNDVGEAPRIVNTLLQLLEDYDAPGLLVAATNLDDTLDKAIFRRFDDVFEVPPPGPDEILKLLRLTLSSIDIAHDIDWARVGRDLEGMSAANVVSAAQDAAKTAILESELPVRQRHLLSAISEIRRTG